MVSRTDFTQLYERDSELTKAALRQKCEVCKAAINRFCTDTITGGLLHESQWKRWVHLARLLQEAA